MRAHLTAVIFTKWCVHFTGAYKTLSQQGTMPSSSSYDPLLIQCLGQCSLYFTPHWGLQDSESSVRSTWDTQELTAVAKKMLHFLMVFMEKYSCT